MISYIAPLPVGEITYNDKYSDNFYVNHWWRFLNAFPLVMSIAQVFLLLCFFPYDSPYHLTLNKDDEILKALLNKLYKNFNENMLDLLYSEEDIDKMKPSFYQSFRDSKYR
jgi:hypothetical protein